jgi:Fe-S-cluster containining protein
VTPERNSPCPCGSGKKYKKCCGSGVGERSDREAAVQRCRLNAYEGEQGRRREDFCRRYTAYKKARLAELESGQRQAIEAQGKVISCGRGCAHCCHVYVSATLPECEAVVYYLYHHEDALRNFLKNYPGWLQAIRHIDHDYHEVGRLRSRQLAGLDDAAERSALKTALNTYAGQYIPCPFLAEGACTIYEVRPYVCAGLVATTPGEWCRFGHPESHRVELHKAGILLDRDMPYLDNHLVKVMLSNLPSLVHALLYRGWDILGRVSGRAITSEEPAF